MLQSIKGTRQEPSGLPDRIWAPFVLFVSFLVIEYATISYLFSYLSVLPQLENPIVYVKYFIRIAGFGSKTIENNIAINEYMSFVVSLLLAAGVVFELPMVSWFLSKLGILTPAFMRKYRRHSIVVIFIVAAVLTPGTDPVSQILLAIPLLILYEISIWVSVWAWRGKRAADEAPAG